MKVKGEISIEWKISKEGGTMNKCEGVYIINVTWYCKSKGAVSSTFQALSLFTLNIHSMILKDNYFS